MKRGYLLTETMIAVIIAGIVATIFTTMNYYTYLQSNMLKEQNTKITLDIIRSRLLNLAKDIDNDSFFEPIKEQTNNSLPLEVGLSVDGWGRAIFYSTIDLGVPNTINNVYSNTSTSISPNTNIVARLISLGQNGILETQATDINAKGDDILLEIGLGELNHFKLYGSSEITTQTRGYNSAIVSPTAPATPIEGTLWYDTTESKLKIYNNSNWISF